MLLSKNEDKVCGELRKRGFVVFKVKDLQKLLEMDKTKAYNIIKALKKKKVIKKMKNFLAFADEEDFAVGNSIHYPSYISFWTALSYYGWSDQNPRVIFLATTRYKKQVESFKYVTLAKKRFFGYRKEGKFAIAEKEKAIIDSLLLPKYSGGIREIRKCLENAFAEINKEKLIEYAGKIGSKAVMRRLGYLLNNLGYKQTGKLKKKMGSGYELLDPSLKRKYICDKEWLLDVNE